MSSRRCLSCAELIVKMAEADRRWLRSGSSESPGDVRLGALVRRAREHAVGRPDLDEPSEVEECGRVGDARRLLQVVRDDDDRQLALQLVQQLLDLLRGDRIERARRLVEQQDFWLVGQRARDAEPLLLAAGEPERALAQTDPSLRPTAPRAAAPTRRSRRGRERLRMPLMRGPYATLS